MSGLGAWTAGVVGAGAGCCANAPNVTVVITRTGKMTRFTSRLLPSAGSDPTPGAGSDATRGAAAPDQIQDMGLRSPIDTSYGLMHPDDVSIPYQGLTPLGSRPRRGLTP